MFLFLLLFFLRDHWLAGGKQVVACKMRGDGGLDQDGDSRAGEKWIV